MVNHLKQKLKAFEAELVRQGETARRYRFDRERLDQLFATLNSCLGHTQIASTASLWHALWERHAWLAAYFRFDSGERRLVRRYLPPEGACRAVQQYRHYRRHFPESVLLFQVGRFFEFYERRDDRAAARVQSRSR